MFKRLFNKNHSDGLSKNEYWDKWELHELFDDLDEVVQILKDVKNTDSNNDLVNFKDIFIEEFYEIKGDNVADFTSIWQWFSPNNEWDKVMGLKGKELGISIFKRTDRWKRNHDFLPKTIVSLDNEFGVVLDKTTGNNLFGLILWDTENKYIEDWCGLFGSFLQAGGQVIEQDYEFTFINKDGTEKQASR
jgi:hypothetical protein